MNIRTTNVTEVSEMPSCDRSVICRLMTEGSYEMLVARIFSHLDLVSLTACGRVSSLWRTCISAILNTCPRALRLDTQHLSRWRGRTATVRSVVLPTGEVRSVRNYLEEDNHDDNLQDLLGKLSNKICQSYFCDNMQVNEKFG